MKKCSILLFFIPIITLSLLYNLSAEDTTKAKDEVTSKQKIEKTSKPKKEIAIKEVNTIIKEEPFEFRKVFDLDGETNNEIIEDRDGFLWFGSYVGLVRYDGYDTKYYKAGPDSISANSIVDLFEDNDGLIWIGTKDGGINSYNKETDKFTQYKNNPKDKNSISDNNLLFQSTNKILQDKDGFLWIGTIGGLNRFDKKKNTFRRYLHDKNNPNSLINDRISSIIMDKSNDDYLWIGTEDGLDRLNIKTGLFTHYKHNPDEKNSLPSNDIVSVFSEANGSLWVGTAKGVVKYDSKTANFNLIKGLPTDKPWAMSKDRNDLFISYFTQRNGFIRYNIKTGEITKYKSDPNNNKSISTGTIRNVFVDKNGAYWVINATGQIDKFDPKEKKFKLYKKGKGSLNDNVAFPRVEDTEGNVWIGTLAHGPTIYNRENGTFNHYSGDLKKNPKSLPNNYASAIFEDSNGDFWIGTLGGFCKYNKDTYEAEKVIKEIDISYSILGDTENPDLLWIVTYKHGFFKYNKKTNKFKNYKHDKNNPDSIAHDFSLASSIDKNNPNIIWIAQHGGGLDKFDKTTEKFTHYKHNSKDKSSISSNIVWSVYQDSKGNIWACTDSGLDKLDKKTGTFKHYTEGFPGKITFIAVEDDSGNLWVATSGGVVKFDLDSEQVKRVYTTEDGIDSHSFFSQGLIKTKDGEIFLGGMKGMNSFYPDKLKDNSLKPPVYLTSLEQGGKPIKTDSALEKVDEVVLDTDDNFFEFKYAALNYTNPSKNRYKYILEGWDKEWFDAGTTRKARYTGLTSGMYTLKIKGANNDGLWSDKEAKVNVYVKPDLKEIPLQFTLAELKESNKISFGHDNDKFSFEVAPLDYSIVDDNRYSYMLEGYDKDWINSANRRYAHYNQVPAGNYKLKVREGDKIVLDVPVIINPPFYSTLWFRSAAIAALIILFIIIYLLRTRALRQKHAQLEKIVAERTKELQEANSELTVSRKKAEAATKAKSEFLANMSHEIRTPMNAILGFSEILLNKEENPKSKRFLSTIFSSGNSLLRLINDILDLSKVEAGKLEIQYKATNIQSIFKETGLVFSQKLKEKNLDFVLDIQKDIPEVLLLDETRLRQILTNLMGNSIKFTERGFIKLSVKYSYPEAGKSLLNLVIAVEDSGIGIPIKDQKTIFDSFTQVSGQKSEKYGGTGLGLTITKRLIEAMNGTISLESEESKGTVFNIKLKNVEITALDVQTDRTDDVNPASIVFKKAKILIVDDIEYNRELLKSFFEDYDFEIFEAEDGVKAVELAKKYDPDLIMLDLKMPVMNGHEVTNILKSDEKLRKISIVVLTASAMKEDEIAIKKVCDGYLKKPVRKGILVQELMKFLPYETLKVKTVKEQETIKITDEKLLAQIKTDVLPIIDDLLERQSIKKLEILTQKCSELGSSHNNEILTGFSKKLSVSQQEYNLDALEELVANFKEMICCSMKEYFSAAGSKYGHNQ